MKAKAKFKADTDCRIAGNGTMITAWIFTIILCGLVLNSSSRAALEYQSTNRLIQERSP